MKYPALLLSLACALAVGSIARAADDYPLTPDSLVQPGVPKGEILQFTFDRSKIFPGTVREVWVYVPRQYTGAEPACLYVGQDGIRFEAPTVFDNLINKKEMPVTIGVFVMHGKVPSPNPAGAQDRFNRSYEYDGLGDNYVRFLLEELLPEVETKKTADGRALRLSPRGADRAIGGASSGAIAAFTAAWERPESFSRVFSAIGTYVDLRGGNRYQGLVRKTEPKPIRVFLQDGSNDKNTAGGDWWMANQTLERALVFAGYEVQHAWGDGGHTHKHGNAVFPDAMRWLWKGWPEPVKTGQSQNEMLAALLIPGEEWQLVGEGYGSTEGAAANAKGEVFFNDTRNSKTYQVGPNGRAVLFLDNAMKPNGQAFGPDGRRFVVTGEKTIVAYDSAGKMATVAEGISGNDLVVARNGDIYATEPPASSSNDPSKVWLIRPSGEKIVVDTGLRYANGVALSPDQAFLYVDDWRSHWVYNFRIQADGTLTDKQRYDWLHLADSADEGGADGMKVDQEGRLYVATRLGVQVCDQIGKVNCILPTPNRRISNLCFGGADFSTLYVTCGDKVYRRKLKTQGLAGWSEPRKPPLPKL
jgi:gluconolactonase